MRRSFLLINLVMALGIVAQHLHRVPEEVSSRKPIPMVQTVSAKQATVLLSNNKNGGTVKKISSYLFKMFG
jgi:hypothetical protein